MRRLFETTPFQAGALTTAQGYAGDDENCL
jgi:hypothetical protein